MTKYNHKNSVKKLIFFKEKCLIGHSNYLCMGNNSYHATIFFHLVKIGFNRFQTIIILPFFCMLLECLLLRRMPGSTEFKKSLSLYHWFEKIYIYNHHVLEIWQRTVNINLPDILLLICYKMNTEESIYTTCHTEEICIFHNFSTK